MQSTNAKGGNAINVAAPLDPEPCSARLDPERNLPSIAFLIKPSLTFKFQISTRE
jgi:hypothetical protein